MNRKKIVMIFSSVFLITIMGFILIMYMINKNDLKYYEDMDQSISEATDENAVIIEPIIEEAVNQEPTTSDAITVEDDTQIVETPVGEAMDPEDMEPIYNDAGNEIAKNGLVFAVFGTDERATEASRSDIIMVAKYNNVTNLTTLVSIPRDTRVQIPGRNLDKINHAYAFGKAELLQESLENLFQVQIDYYVQVNFVDFEAIIDEFGGVDVEASKNFGTASETIIPKGTSTLNGEKALYYVRYRSDNEGDYGRIRRQQEVLQSLRNKISQLDDGEIVQSVGDIYADYLDTNLSFDGITNFIIDNKEHKEMETYTLSTKGSKINGIWYEIYDEENLQEMRKLIVNN